MENIKLLLGDILKCDLDLYNAMQFHVLEQKQNPFNN